MIIEVINDSKSFMLLFFFVILFYAEVFHLLGNDACPSDAIEDCEELE